MGSKKKLLFLIAVIFVILGGGYAFQDQLGLSNGLTAGQNVQSSEPENRRQMAPDFTISTTDGTTQKLSDLKGKVVVLNFWSVDCPPCLQEVKNIQAVYENKKSEVMFVGVATDKATAEETKAVLAENGGSYPVMVDQGNSTFGLYGVRATPTTVIVNAEGEVAGGHTGYATEEQLMALIGRAS